MFPTVVMPPASAAAEPEVKSSTHWGPSRPPGWARAVDVRIDTAWRQQLACSVDLYRRLELAANLGNTLAANADIRYGTVD